MYTFIFLCCFLGFYILYNLSKRAKLSSTGLWERWLQQHRNFSRVIGILLILVSIAFFIYKSGWAVGLFGSSLLLMSAAFIVVTITPFHYLNKYHVGSIIIISFLIETIFR